MVIIRRPVFICNMVLYISLGGRIHKKTAFHAYLGRMYYCTSLVILMKTHYLTGLCTFLLPISFSQVNIHIYSKVCRDLKSVGNAKTCNCFSKICRGKIEFLQTFEWQETLRRKTNKCYDKTATQNDPGNNTKKL